MHAPLFVILSIFSIFARGLQFQQLLEEPENIVVQKDAISTNLDEQNALSSKKSCIIIWMWLCCLKNVPSLNGCPRD